MVRHGLVFFLFLCYFLTGAAQTSSSDVEQLMNDFFTQYTCEVQIKKTTLEKVDLDNKKKTLTIYVNEAFAGQPFTPQTVAQIYQQIKNRLPRRLSNYKIKVITDNQSIDDLIPNEIGRAHV